jgi:hypothetical protein
MTATQRFAWFNLAVIGLTLAVVLLLLAFIGKGALGGFGILGLIGFGPVFFRRRQGQIVADERDQQIQRRAWIIGYAVFWVLFVLTAVLVAPLVYGQEGSVPVWAVQMSVFAGFMTVYAVGSIAILVQYAGGTMDAQ